MPSPRPDRLLSYMPHNGLTDQLRQLSLAVAVAEALGRTLVVPPLLSHFDATANTASVVLARKIRRAQRPPLSMLINLTALGVAVVDDSADLWHSAMHDLPSCISISNTSTSTETAGGEAARGAEVTRNGTVSLPPCVHAIEPPEKHASQASAGAALRSWRRLRHVRWLHFRSLLWVHAARQAGRYPLPSWEEELEPTPCRIRYRHDVIASARAVLRPALPPDYLAAHVRDRLPLIGSDCR